MVEIILFLFFLLVAAILAIQIANESILALRVKQFLFLVQPYSKRLLALSHFNTWWKLLPRFFLILLPLIILIVLVLRFHHFLSEVLDCSRCLSYHIGWILLFFVGGMTIWYSLLFATLSILFVYLIERLNR